MEQAAPEQVIVQPARFGRPPALSVSPSVRAADSALPHETVDATVVASHIVVAWQSVVARSVDPAQTAVISVGTLYSGDVNNVISGVPS